MRLGVGSLVATWCCDGRTEHRWLSHYEAWQQWAQEAEHELRLCLVAEEYGGGGVQIVHMFRLAERVRSLGGEVIDLRLRVPWHEEDDVGTWQRQAHVDCARNLISCWACLHELDYLLCLDADVLPHPELLRRLVELAEETGHPILGGHVPSYCLDGPRVEEVRGHDVRAHWNTAGALLLHRDVFRSVLWHREPWRGLTDDPAYQAVVRERFGAETWVCHDLVCEHEPLVPVEARLERVSSWEKFELC